MKAGRNQIQTCLLCALMLQALTSGAQPVTKIAGGAGHSLFLKSDGSLWAMGWNDYGQLGNGTYNNTNLPQLIVASNVTAIAGGNSHSLFLKSDGSLWAMGYNIYGQLGDGTYSTNYPYYGTNQPEMIAASNVTAISAGGGHSLFLKSDGSLWGMGYNYFGQLGDGKSGVLATTNQPEQIVGSNVTAIAAGTYHSLFLKSDGSLWGMGMNNNGQLGDGTTSEHHTPEQIVASNVTAIVAGNSHSLFLKNNGSLWGMGYNSYGELGDGTFIERTHPEQIVASNVTAIAAGGIPNQGNHSLILKNDTSLWTMGDNHFGESGAGLLPSVFKPYVVTSYVTAIVAGGLHSVFIRSDGSLWVMGANNYGELGDGTLNNTNQPEQILGPYNQIQTTGQLVGGTNMQLSFVGVANANYALDWSGSLSPPNWIPQATNPASSFGPLVFTNPPVANTNNFWRIRSVP
jgi:alpha-tubulin suppressor-like RCC1 family protein